MKLLDLNAFRSLSAKVNSPYVYITLTDVIDALHFDDESKLKVGNDMFEFYDTYHPFYPDGEDYCRLTLNGKEVFFSDKPHKHEEWMNTEATRLYVWLETYFEQEGGNTMPTPKPVVNFDRSAYSVSQIKELGLALGLPEDEIVLAVLRNSKTMYGKETVINMLFEISISVHTDDTGYEYTPDQLICDIVKKAGTPTFSGTVLQSIIKDIWTNVSPTLHQYPKGHALIKSLIIELNKELCGKNATGVKQVRELVKLKSLELYSQF